MAAAEAPVDALLLRPPKKSNLKVEEVPDFVVADGLPG